MKTWQNLAGRWFLVVAAILCIGANVTAQSTNRVLHTTTSPYAALQNPNLTNFPGAYLTLSNILASPTPAEVALEISSTNAVGSGGTYYSLQLSSQPPLPADFFPTLPVYPLDETDSVFVIDDRSVN
jgi:hypothetical protein